MSFFKTFSDKVGYNAGSALAGALRAIAANFASIEPAVKVSAAADYSPALGETVISRTNAGAQTLTLPTNATTAIPIGAHILVEQTSAGALTIQGAAGVTVNHLATKTLVCAAQFGIVRLTKISANVWNASGDLTAAA